MEENQDILKGIIQLVIIIVVTVLFFSLYSKKLTNLSKLLPLVLISVWISVSIFLGIEYLIFRDANMFIPITEFISLLKEALPMSMIFGGLVFIIKYRKFRKKNS